MHYSSTKTIPLGSCAFRQPYATSHCKYIHGYRLQAKFWFACEKLDQNNWVVDFGSLKPLKTILEQQFDHTTVIWTQDPELQTFIDLNKKGIIDLRIMKDGVGIEKFAEYCFNKADEFVRNFTSNRCWVEKVEVWEHEQNSATYENNNVAAALQPPVLEQIKKTDTPKPTSIPEPKPDLKPEQPKQVTDLGQPGVKTKGYSNLFAGTSWGGNNSKGNR